MVMLSTAVDALCSSCRTETTTTDEPVSLRWCNTCGYRTTFIINIDGPALAKHKRFAQMLAVGATMAEAAERVGYSLSHASGMARHPAVVDYIHSLQEEAQSAAVMGLDELAQFLTRVLRTSPADVGSDSDLCQEYHANGDGTEKVKMYGKHQAAELLVKLLGYAPSPATVNITNTTQNNLTVSPSEVVRQWRTKLESNLRLPVGTLTQNDDVDQVEN